MWYKGHKFCTKELDEKRKNFDCGINVVFHIANISSISNTHPKVSENQYYGYLDDILECDFDSFKMVVFDVKWYMLRMNENDPDKTII